VNVLLLGNPNVGKTSLFNHITGSSARVGNYPGVTVERREGSRVLKRDDSAPVELNFTDAPGTYSLSARSHEEQVAIQATLGLADLPRPDVVVAVVNATQLSRNLYLVSQLLELRVPTVVALTMMDEAEEGAPDPAQLSELLGAPCVATHGDTGEGVEELVSAIVKRAEGPAPTIRLAPKFDPSSIAAADRIADALPSSWRGNVERDRTLALWALSSIDEDDELEHIPSALREKVLSVRTSGEHDFDLDIAQARYHAIDSLLESLSTPAIQAGVNRAEQLDRFLLHPVYGFLAFIATMLVVFQALFSWADPGISLVETLVGASQEFAAAKLPPGIFADLIIEGVLGGVGNVIVFLPQILLLFLFVGLLEDSGYMARVAYLMDRVMRGLGLHGRAFVPMLSGFACAIPAIMATRTLERRRDQLLTMMVVPLMTCSARLPVYTLIIAALFPVSEDSSWPVQGLLMIALYLFSILTALVAAWVLGKTVIKGRSVPLILELPPYRLPRLGPTFRMMKLRGGQFLKEAGTVILAATILLWALLSFPREESTDKNASVDSAAMVQAAPSLENSYAGRLGKTIEPAMEPLGFDWKLTTGIIGAFAAREVFVSTLGLVFGIGEMDDDALPLRERIKNDKNPDGSARYTPLMGLSLMIFFALACQCMSTLAVVKRETGGYKWPAFLFTYMTALAYICSLVVFQIGSLLGY